MVIAFMNFMKVILRKDNNNIDIYDKKRYYLIRLDK